MSKFVHLHVHSEYSMADGMVRIKPLMQHSHEMGLPAVAVTDLNNLFAAIKTYQTALANGVKPILGAEILLSQG